jgi:hypothetical protein
VTASERDDLVDVAKLGRMHGMIERILDELRTTALDAATVERLELLTRDTIVEIGSAVPDELLRELSRVIGSATGAVPTADELRIIEAQLLGWLRGMAGAERLEDLRTVVAEVTEQVARGNGAALTVASGYL